jgi:hypothetical protein
MLPAGLLPTGAGPTGAGPATAWAAPANLTGMPFLRANSRPSAATSSVATIEVEMSAAMLVLAGPAGREAVGALPGLDCDGAVVAADALGDGEVTTTGLTG